MFGIRNLEFRGDKVHNNVSIDRIVGWFAFCGYMKEKKSTKWVKK
jgi:hypothetical protein